MAAKIAHRSNGNGVQTLPADKRWTIVSVETGRAIYLPGEHGLTEADANRISDSLAVETEVVPAAALDRFSRLDRDRLESALEAAHAEEE